jgi:chromosome segregation ATPase
MASELAEAKKALSAKEKANQKLQEKYDNCVEDLQDAESEVKELQVQIKRKVVVARA